MVVAAAGCLLLLLPQGPDSRASKGVLEAGRWVGSLASPGGQLEFGMRIWRQGERYRLAFLNGPEAILYEKVRVADGVLQVRLVPYDSQLRARVHDGGRRLVGVWTKTRAGGKKVKMVFEARRGERGKSSSMPAAIPGRWAVRFEKGEHPAVGIFAKGEGGFVNGTFLTTLGDYRFLSGNFRKGRLTLSCFDGAHAFLFKADVADDGTLKGDFWSSDTWHETWTARKDAKARLPDAFALTRWNRSVRLGDLGYPDLQGKRRRLDDAAFAGRARVLQVFGSWCPNCKDASAYLAQLDKRYRSKGLRIVGLAFEHAGAFETNAAQVRAYVKRQGIEYPVLVAGPSDKGRAQKAFPALDRILAYPTTVFLDREGRVRAVHTGFAGPATGEEHRRLRQRFEEIIEGLLGR